MSWTKTTLAAAAVLGALAFPAASSASLPKVLTQDEAHPFVVRPASISYTGDGTGVIGGFDGTYADDPGHLTWGKYTKNQGRATGALWLDDCDPSCAEGTFTAVPVSVHVFRPSHGRFTRLTLKYTYQNDHYTDRRAIRHYSSDGYGPSYWMYYIL
ncbi:MAG: hypothetical protein QOE06_1428 [Thermoleophilaceae bacterium]|jgi:hypothetical protein|nr:hypothetical protein [Thermoleophilaceae bacterium]